MENEKFSVDELVSKIDEKIKEYENKENSNNVNKEQSDLKIIEFMEKKARSNFKPTFDVRDFICQLEEKINEINTMIDKAKEQLNSDSERFLIEKLNVMGTDEFDKMLDEVIEEEDNNI